MLLALFFRTEDDEVRREVEHKFKTGSHVTKHANKYDVTDVGKSSISSPWTAKAINTNEEHIRRCFYHHMFSFPFSLSDLGAEAIA